MEKRKIEPGIEAIYTGSVKTLFGLQCHVGGLWCEDEGKFGVTFRDVPHSKMVKSEDLLPLSECGRVKLTLGIDFDDTIVHTAWPDIKGFRDGAKEAINKLYDDGHYIIINTCRYGNHQHEAEVFLYQNGVHYNSINRHNPTAILTYQNDTRKIWADVYVDDKDLKSVLYGLPEWPEIYRMINLISIRKWLMSEYTNFRIPEKPAKIPQQQWIQLNADEFTSDAMKELHTGLDFSSKTLGALYVGGE